MEPIDIRRYPLPTPILQSLLKLVEVAERNQAISVFFMWQQSSEESGAFDLMIDDRKKGEYVAVPRLKENPIAVLEKLGVVERLSKNNVLLHPAAFERAKYERARFGNKMTRTRTVKFTDGRWLPTTLDGSEYELKYSVVDTDLVGEPDEFSRTTHGSIVVFISGSRAATWRLDRSSLEKVLFEYAKRYIRDKVVDNTLSEREELQLTTSTTPDECQFDPKRIEISLDEPFEFPVAVHYRTLF